MTCRLFSCSPHFTTSLGVFRLGASSLSVKLNCAGISVSSTSGSGVNVAVISAFNANVESINISNKWIFFIGLMY